MMEIKKKNLLKLIIFLFIVSLILPQPSLAESIPDDWSKDAVIYGLDKEYILGDKDGKLNLDNSLTRAEFIAIINRISDNEASVDLSNYKDMDKSSWYYEDMGKAVASGLIQGDGEYLRPLTLITREEAFVIINRKLGLKEATSYRFNDHKDISSWALKDIYSLYERDYIQGNQGLINPKKEITKKELLQIIYNIYARENLSEEGGYLVESENDLKRIIYENMNNFNDEILIKSKSLNFEDLERIIYKDKLITKILLENPGLSYGYNAVDLIDQGEGLTKIKLYYTRAHLNSFDVEKMEEYKKSKEDMENERNLVEAKVSDIIAEIIKEDMTSLEKEKAIHDWIIKNARYDHEDKKAPYRRNNYTPYGVLIEGLGVCESYAKSFYLLAKEAGLEVIYLTGYAGEYHAWNMVKLDDGEWYHVDVTWNDLGDTEVRYDYFNLTDEEIRKDHSIYKLRDYPEAKGEKYFRDNLSFSKDTEIN